MTPTTLLRYRLHGDGRLTVQRAYEVGDDLEWYDVELDIEEIEEANANSNMQSGSNLPSARNV
jgi:hypothetical protein